MESLLGKMTLAFADGRTSCSFTEHEVRIGGEIKQPKGFDCPMSSYEVLYSDEHVIVLSVIEDDTGNRVAQTLYFDGPDVFWVYGGGSNVVSPDMHFREYFRRVR